MHMRVNLVSAQGKVCLFHSHNLSLPSSDTWTQRTSFYGGGNLPLNLKKMAYGQLGDSFVVAGGMDEYLYPNGNKKLRVIGRGSLPNLY